MQADHTGLSYHAPGPDGAQWLHLRAGQPGAVPGQGQGQAPWAEQGEGEGGWPGQYGFDPHGLGQQGMGQHQMM